jgi:hypothetical protein
MGIGLKTKFYMGLAGGVYPFFTDDFLLALYVSVC